MYKEKSSPSKVQVSICFKIKKFISLNYIKILFDDTLCLNIVMIMMFVGPKCFSIEDVDGLGVNFIYSQN